MSVYILMVFQYLLLLGVADGVGGWRNYGVDPSRFSYSMMNACAHLVAEGFFRPDELRELIANSYEVVKNASFLRNENSTSKVTGCTDGIIGSSTVCIVALERTASQVHTANLGDSGLLLFRDGELLWQSTAQQHEANVPFQLALVPEDQYPNCIADPPDAADVNSVDVDIGDCVVMGTDGLFDNMPVELIEEEVASLRSCTYTDVKRLSDAIAQKAKMLSQKPKFPSSFARKFGRQGGKPDDITVIAAVVARVGREGVDAV
ncbi:Protein phosphatase PTC7 homolog [Trichuris trichiura]|uniref:Protein phosphatase n=1 Tax=Trichuris trichiura TaxID=36087 RepID=A0A077ZBU6_TRITR|nr:Protein phosphatase PTC7 homolog [Trichuris trichiura]